MAALARGWTDADGPRPVVWSPAAAAWGAVLNTRLADQGKPPLVGEGTPFMLSPLVIAMPRPMAEALGYPAKPLGWADILALATSSGGWASVGHPEWGPFRLGKTNPNFSTSGLNALIAQAYAATGKSSGLSPEDLARPDVEAFARGVESAVVHYGDTTLTFLNNLYRADRRGTALSYASAVAVEEQSVISYNQGNPDGILDPGEQPRPPKVPLVAVYPKEGTLYSDHPFFVLDAGWVRPEQRDAAQRFADFVLRPESQQKVISFGLRPANPQVPKAAPLVRENGVDPDQPATELRVPDAHVVSTLLDDWQQQRKGARVLLVIDVSGSMGDPAGQGDRTKLELAQDAATSGVDQFGPDDQVGLRVFSTNLDAQHAEFLDLVPVGRVGDNREEMKSRIRSLVPVQGTPLYSVAARSYDDALAAYDPARINAVVLLTDGQNDDGRPDDDPRQLTDLLGKLRAGSEGVGSRPVRVFTIGYGASADFDKLRQIAEASNAKDYKADNPLTIDAVFSNVISNF
jgi:Ca-activated chloride channel family protein